MRCLSYYGKAILISVLVLAFELSAWGEDTTAKAKTKSIVAGSWRVQSIVRNSPDGKQEKLPDAKHNRTFSMIISNDKLMLYAEDNKFAELPYTLDAEQTTPTINVNFAGQELSGIFELESDTLKIVLNDVKKDRPKDFAAKDNDMEIILQRFLGEPLMVVNTDGTGSHTLISMPEFTSCGSPRWSPDGKKIAFDCWRSIFGESYESSHIFTVNADGSDPKDLGDGTLPSWSPDSKQIAFSRYNSDQNIWIMNADGTNLHEAGIGQGWCADWSPKGDELAVTVRTENGFGICIFNLKTNDRRLLLDSDASDPITVVTGSAYWSPDAQWICFHAKTASGKEHIALVSPQGQAKGFKILLPTDDIKDVKDFSNYYSWTPNGKQMLLPVKMNDDENLQLYLVDPEGKNPPKKFPGQLANVRNYGNSWSPDGKQIVYAFWPSENTQKKSNNTKQIQRGM